ncbi:MAG: Nucleoside triphosphate pyrophosphohydrolase [Bacteroidota bacterium]|nr:Nucleoside triphosphate pyrophosphohydrolase [Bacteroidota bacterium]
MADNKIEIPVAKDENNVEEQFMALCEIIRLLRIHCPWDKKQTNESIAHLLIEESYETIDAIHKGDDEEFSGELGDILLHIIMHCIMAEERNAFDLIKVITKIQHKLVFRHPHVFGDVEVRSEDDVMVNWENLKKKEGKRSALQGVPLNLPSLLRAERIQHKASRVGFDWNNKEDVWLKVEEELAEFKKEITNGSSDKKTREFGDLLFSLVNAARFEGNVPEEALQFTNEKFTRRFQYIEEKAESMGRKLTDMTLAEMDAIWDEAKGKE